MTEAITVALVDDQTLVRAGFRMVIDSQPDLRVVWEAANGYEAVRSAAADPVDVICMDVRMPVLDGLAAAAQILGPATGVPTGGTRIIILTTFDLDEYVMTAIRAGASGFLLKDSPPEETLAATRTVHAGDAVIAPSSTRRLIEKLAAEPPITDDGVLDRLTSREHEVLIHIARGESNAEIAHNLHIAEATIKTHVGRILTKLDARDRVQAVVFAYESGLVRPGDGR